MFLSLDLLFLNPLFRFAFNFFVFFDVSLYLHRRIDLSQAQVYSATGLTSSRNEILLDFSFRNFTDYKFHFFFFFYLVSILREGKSDRKSFSSPSRHTSHASPIREGCTVYSTVYFVRSSGTVLFSICSTRSMLFYSASSATRAHRTSFLLATSVSHLIPRGPNAFSVEWRAWKRFSSAAQ